MKPIVNFLLKDVVTRFTRAGYQRMSIILCLSATLLAGAPIAAAQTGFSIQPLKLNLSGRQKNTSIELTNLTNQTLPIQIKLFSWSQKNGEQVLEPSRDVFFAPPITNVEANSKQTVRFRLKRGADVDRERSYRLFIEQLPPTNPALAAAMDFRLRFNIPLFVAAVRYSDPDFLVTATAVEGGLRVRLNNRGKSHVKVKNVAVYKRGVRLSAPTVKDVISSVPGSSAGTSYALPGTELEWLLPLPPGTPPAEALEVALTTNFYNNSGRGAVKPSGIMLVPITGEPINSSAN